MVPLKGEHTCDFKIARAFICISIYGVSFLNRRIVLIKSIFPDCIIFDLLFYKSVFLLQK